MGKNGFTDEVSISLCADKKNSFFSALESTLRKICPSVLDVLSRHGAWERITKDEYSHFEVNHRFRSLIRLSTKFFRSKNLKAKTIAKFDIKLHDSITTFTMTCANRVMFSLLCVVATIQSNLHSTFKHV